MKGTHLVRVTKSQGGLPLPLRGVGVETFHLTEPLEVAGDTETLYLCLDGEVVLDYALEFVHLRALETFTVSQAHKLSPVAGAIVLRVKLEST
jgi:hypothetical protein